MPAQCPLAFETCNNCRNYFERTCGYYFPPLPLSEILTLEEKIEWLEKNPQETRIIYVHTDGTEANTKILRTLQSQVAYLLKENKSKKNFKQIKIKPAKERIEFE